jgi:phosphonate transport system ATP-binding protein
LISFENVTKEYDDGTLALDNVSLHIPSGQFCVLLGPSGAGKSTLLRTINGLARPSSGRIMLDGVELNELNLRQIRRKVAMVHQDYNLSGRSSVAVNVMSGALVDVPLPYAMLGWFPEKIRKKCCMLLDKVGLEEKHLSRQARSLSGGQQQRVGIARSLILDPQVLLADEPISSLDPGVSVDILNILRDIAIEYDCTIVCSLHQVELARKFADRIIGMESGRIVFDLLSEEVDDEVLSSIYTNYEAAGERSVLETARLEHLLQTSLKY